MAKNGRVELRVKEKDKETCSFLNLSYSHVWDLGMEHIYKNIAKYVAKLYVQKGKIEANVRTAVFKEKHRYVQLDALVDEFIATRNLKKPSKEDLFWISSRIEKIDGLTVEGFLSYCKFKKEGK